MSLLFRDILTGRNISFLFLLFSVVLLPALAWCDKNELTPFIHLRQEYSDNLFMSAAETLDDFILTVSPGLKISRKSERLKLNLNSRFDRTNYFDHTELNGNDIRVSGNTSVSATERLSFSADLAYMQDSRPDRDLDDSGLVLDATRRDRYTGGISSNFLLTERTSATFSGSYRNDDYQLQQDSAYDLEAYSASMGIFHQPAHFDHRTTIYSNLQYSRYEYEQSTVDYYALLAGLDNQLSEMFGLRFDLGARYTRSEFQTFQLVFDPLYGYAVLPVEVKSTNWGAVGKINLSYVDEYIHFTLSAAHDIEPASGRQGSSERTTIRASLGRRFSEELKCSVEGSYYFNNAKADQFSSNAINEKTLRGAFHVRYNFNRLMYIENGWSYSRITDSIANTTADRNLAFIAFTYNFEID